MYYAIADLHGRFDLLKEAVNAIEKHSGNSSETVIVTLGDYVDRGPQSKDIIDFLMKHNMKCLQGNHEAMMVETVTTPLLPSWWIGNGGDATLQSYGWGGEPFFISSYDVIPKAHIEWLQSLPIYFETDKQVFVHAGIPQPDMNLPPSSKTAHKKKHLEEQMQWMLYNGNKSGGWRGKHVVHGHHQSANGPHVFHGKDGGRTNLDTYAYRTGRLVVGVFDDTQGPPVDFIEVTCTKNGL